MIKVKFAPTSMGQRVQELLEGDFGLKGVSVGFIPRAFEFSRERKGGIDYTSQELLEVSVTPVPANSNAVLQRSLSPEERKAEACALVARIRADDAKWDRQRKAEAERALERDSRPLPPRKLLPADRDLRQQLPDVLSVSCLLA